MAENLHAEEEFSSASIKCLVIKVEKEVEFSIRRLFSYAAWADKFDGSISGVPVRVSA